MYAKFAGLAGHVRWIFKMSGEELLLNSINCPAKNSKCPAKPKKTSRTLILADNYFQIIMMKYGLWLALGRNINVIIPDKHIPSISVKHNGDTIAYFIKILQSQQFSIKPCRKWLVDDKVSLGLWHFNLFWTLTTNRDMFGFCVKHVQKAWWKTHVYGRIWPCGYTTQYDTGEQWCDNLLLYMKHFLSSLMTPLSTRMYLCLDQPLWLFHFIT